MEGSLNQLARFQYASALKSGQRVFRERTSRGERGYLPALDDMIRQTPIMAYMNQAQREISLNRVIGTYTTSRANSFAANFMPLHHDHSEFAAKWMNLCTAHMEEGLRDPVQVYEYLWEYYVVEGNKRVSILKHYGAPTVRADITRVVPQLDENDPQTAVYYAYLRYDKSGRFKNIRLSSQSAYEQLAELEVRLTDQPDIPAGLNYNGMYLQFEAAYPLQTAPIPLGDAFLEYLKVYGLPVDTTLSQIKEQLTSLLPQLELAGRPQSEPNLLLNPHEKPTTGLISRLFGQKRSAEILFAYPEGRTEGNWLGAHERGRQFMQKALGDRVTSGIIDGVTPASIYEKLSENAENANLLLITASSLALPSLRFSLEHPNCLTLIYSRIREDYRLSTYYGRYYEAMFLCGMAAGMATKGMKIAYITPRIEYTRHTSDINAFSLGVKSIRPDAEVMLVWKNVLPLRPETCARGLETAAGFGADVAYTPLYPGLSLPEMPAGVFSIVCRIGEGGEPTEYLAAPQWDWGRYYTEIVQSYLNGSLDILRIIDRGDPSITGMWWGLGAGVLRFLASDALGISGGQMMRFLRSSIALGTFNPFFGPIRDKSGDLRVSHSQGLKPYEILNMEWLCDFIHVIE